MAFCQVVGATSLVMLYYSYNTSRLKKQPYVRPKINGPKFDAQAWCPLE